MARCKRCGTTFDYDKRDGVCPKCCFYNRPPGMASHDEEWLSTYNIEENTYELPRSVVEMEEDHSRRIFHKKTKEERRKYSSDRECRTEGSHIHTDRKARQTRRGQSVHRTENDERSRRKRKWILEVIARVLIPVVIVFFLFGFFDKIPQFLERTDSFEQKNYEIDEFSWEELQDGLTIGDMSFVTDDQGAVVLFNEGEIPDLPVGEKCIGIHLSDDESSLNYSGIDWVRPYVFDGKDYRELVDGIIMNSYKTQANMETDFMSQFVSSFSDFDGMAVYFIDKDADTVRLCIPRQTLDGEEVLCDGTAEIEIPVNNRQEGGPAVE